jgi:hypothetical protein
MLSSPDKIAPKRSRMQVGTEQQFRWLEGIVKSVLVLNLIDAVLTLLWVRAGLAVEANTLMAELVNDHALGFVVVKLALVGMGSWLLWSRRQSALAVIAIFAVFLVYYAILIHHIQYISQLVWHWLG